MTFSDFALRPEILRAIEEAGYTIPTPIQQQAIPAILGGGDVLGIAQTGTGKTAAFVLPMIERLALGQAKARMPRSLILSPTRELASQTADYFGTYGKHLKLSMALLIGGVSLEDQARKLERGVDVLIATPGRLLDQFERGNILLGSVTILVIDEADRMLDMGFIPDVERIVKLLPRRQQTLMFSATMPAEVRRLADAFLNRPTELQASRPATAAVGVSDHLAIVPPRQKFKALRQLIESQEVGKAIIFCNRKREVASLRRQLERAGMNVRDIHGDLDQSQRTQTLDAFKRGEVDFLVATDVAARGLDIAMLPCVINYDVPIHADDYIHRIGRTGRAGQEGRAYTLALPEDARFVDAIARLTGKPIPRLEIAGMEAQELAEDEGRGRRRRGGAKKEMAKAAPGRHPQAEPARPTEAAAEPTRTMPPEAPVPEEVAATAEAAEAPLPEEVAATAEAAEAPAPPRPGGARSRGRRGGARRDAGAAPGPAARQRSRQPAEADERREAISGDRALKDKERRRLEPRSDKPVVGMGDHVPLFMLRPVPLGPVEQNSDEG